MPTGNDIPMVNNITLSGLNGDLWDMNFALNNLHSTFKAVDCAIYIKDRDIGEILINFNII